MLLKSVFQNKIIINILFFVFVFLSAISFLRAFLVHNGDFTIPLLGQMNAPLRVNVEIPHENIKNFHFFWKQKIALFIFFKIINIVFVKIK